MAEKVPGLNTQSTAHTPRPQTRSVPRGLRVNLPLNITPVGVCAHRREPAPELTPGATQTLSWDGRGCTVSRKALR